MIYTTFSLTSMHRLTPILDLLEGYAVQREEITSFEVEDDQVESITFNNGMRLVRTAFRGARNGFAWVLTNVQGAPVAIVEEL